MAIFWERGTSMAIDQVPTGQTFFLKIEGIDGGSRDAKHPGWFEINGYDWELTQSGTAHTGTGSGAGKVAFSDLLIDLNLDFDGLPALLHDAATGTHIKSVELEGVKNGQPFTFYELKLSDVLVTDVVDRAGGHDTLALDFSKSELTTTEQKDDGSAGGSETFAFDVDANKQGLAAFAAALGGVAEAAVPAVAEAAAPAVGETVTVAAAAIDQVPTGQTFFLKIEGIDGGSRDAKHPGWFEINGYDWELTQSGTAHTGTGSGAGKVAFSDLLIDLNLDFDGLPALLHDAATGTHIKSVELEGVKNGQPFTFYELKLSDVLVTDVADRAGSHDTLALDFSKIQLTTTEQKDDGSAGGSETFAFNVGKNTALLANLASDFNGDGNGDLQWQNDDGTPGIWLMNGSTVVSTQVIGTNPGTSWREVGAADFDGDGKSDILWQHNDGTPGLWFLDGPTVLSTSVIGSPPGTDWEIIDTGDFDGDGKADILWQHGPANSASGQASAPGIWLMDGTTVLAHDFVGTPAQWSTAWTVIGSGDFDGDGKSDILWQNNNGQAGIWLMDGINVLATGPVGSNPGPTANVIDSGDFN